MKKVIFALAAVVALAACSQEDVIVADKGAAIGFDTFVGKATRVDDPSLTTENLANFGVFGTVTNTVANEDNTALIFNNVKVAGSNLVDGAGYSTWTYEGTQYWIAGAKYNFAAVAPKTVKVNDVDTDVYTNASYAVTSSVVDDKTVYTGTTTLSFANNGEIDLLYAEATAVGEAGSGDAEHPANDKVGFNFRHILSKVKFSFENQYLSTGSTIRVRDIMLTNAHETATATITTATLNANTAWDKHTGKLSIAFGNAAAASVNALETIAQGSEKESFNVRFIIPGKEHEYTVSFKVDVLYGETVVKTYEHTASVTFKPAAGTAYDIKTVIDHENIDPDNKQEPIEFTVNEFDGWAAPTEQTGTINPAQNN